jgi:hypothetical protein
MEVVLSPLEEATDEAGHNSPEAFESAREKQGAKELLSTQQKITQAGSERLWWRRVFGGPDSEVVEVTSGESDPVGRSLEEFERYTRTKPPGA